MVSKSGCKAWLQQRTNLEKTLLSLSTVLLLTLLLVVLFGISYHGKSGKSTEEESICWNKDCIKTAGQILSAMNTETSSCSNFYDFACGNYGKQTGQTTSVARSSADAVYFNLKRLLESPEGTNIDGFGELKSLYSTCVNFGGFHQAGKEPNEDLKAMMSDFSVGTWPILDRFAEVDSVHTLEQRIVGLLLVDVPVIFRMEVIPDVRMTDTYLIKISPGGPQITGRAHNEIRSDNELQASMLSSFLLLGDSGSAATAVKEILSIDAQFALMEEHANKKCTEPFLLAPQEVLQELNRLIPEMNWTSVMYEIRKATGIVRPYAVELHCKELIRDYWVYISKDIVFRSAITYLGWRFFYNFAEHVDPVFRTPRSQVSDGMPRWRKCVELLERYASPVLAEALSMQLDEDLKEEVQKVATTSISATERLLSKTKWLNQSQKSRIHQQVTSMKFRFPFSQDTGKNASSLLRIDELNPENFTSAVVGLQRQQVILKLRKIKANSGLVRTPDTWISLLTTENSQRLKELPLSLYFDKIRQPYYRSHVSGWLNYGGVGTFIAREISKFLLAQNLGSTLGDQVSLWDIWLSNRNASGCLLNSFADHLAIYSESEKHSIMKELFLDRSALEIAYESAKSGAKSNKKELPLTLDLSDEKAFFLSYAQTMCEIENNQSLLTSISRKQRLNSALLDSVTFAEVFSCDLSSTKCHIWT